MKTQIFALQSHDDLISVRDRMSWAKSRRILLVWPGFERVVLRPTDLRILQQHARYLGSQLGLVTRQGDIRRAAEGFGIPVFRSTADAQRRAWPAIEAPTRQRRLGGRAGAEQLRSMRNAAQARSSRSSNVYVRVGGFAVGVLAVLSLAALFVPRATIRLVPISTEQTLIVPVKISPAAEEAAVGGSVPSRPLSVIVTGSHSAQVTTTGQVPNSKATGAVEFRNLANSTQVIPAGTIVYSISPTTMRFVTRHDAQLPATLGASVEVPIEAVQPGSAGNLPANSIQAVEGSLGTATSVTNPDPTSGGTDTAAAVPSAADRTEVRAELVALLQAEATDKMKTMMGPQDLVLPGTLRPQRVESEEYDPPAGAPGSQITVTMSIDFQAQYVRADDLRQLALGALSVSAPPGYRAVASTLTYDVVQASPPNPAGDGQFDLQVKCRLAQALDLERAAALARGKSPVLAAARLRGELPLASAPEIQLTPSWWPWLPLIPFGLTVTAG